MTVPPGPRSRLPSLGKRGEGWVAAQVGILGLAAAAGLLGPAWPDAAWPWRVAAALAAGLPGLALGIGGGLALGRQLTPLPAPVAVGTLRDRGVYGLCRHPIYGGVVLLGLAWAFVSSPLALAPAALVAVFLDLKRRVEERWLAERISDYEDYRHRVRRALIPYVW